jgi:hypothetical protein
MLLKIIDVEFFLVSKKKKIHQRNKQLFKRDSNLTCTKTFLRNKKVKLLAIKLNLNFCYENSKNGKSKNSSQRRVV